LAVPLQLSGIIPVEAEISVIFKSRKMRKAIYIILLSLLFPIVMKAQLSTNDVKLLRTELAKKINDLRISKGISPLKFSDTLKKDDNLHRENKFFNKNI
jgi:hypothetical protein